MSWLVESGERPRVAPIAEDERLLLHRARRLRSRSGRSRRSGRQRRIGACHHLGYQVMVRRQIAYRIGVGRIAGQQIRLAAAAAEVLASSPGSCGRAPSSSSSPRKWLKASRVAPDRTRRECSRTLGNVRPGQHARGVAGQRGAIGRDGQEYRAQAVHAGLRAPSRSNRARRRRSSSARPTRSRKRFVVASARSTCARLGRSCSRLCQAQP